MSQLIIYPQTMKTLSILLITLAAVTRPGALRPARRWRGGHDLNRSPGPCHGCSDDVHVRHGTNHHGGDGAGLLRPVSG